MPFDEFIGHGQSHSTLGLIDESRVDEDEGMNAAMSQTYPSRPHVDFDAIRALQGSSVTALILLTAFLKLL